MRQCIVFCAIALLLSQTNCNAKKTNITGLWFFMNRTDLILPYDSSVTATSFVDLHADGTYTRDFGSFDYGHWQRKDTILILKPDHRRAVNITIKYLEDDDLELKVNEVTLVDFARMPGKFTLVSDNPFAVENNQWRIPAARKENEDALKSRLRNHCAYFEKYFNWGITDGLRTVDVRATPSLIKIYRNGFVLQHYDELPSAWRAYFYDAEDCRKAYHIMKDVFDHHDITWLSPDNRYVMFRSAFHQLTTFLN